MAPRKENDLTEDKMRERGIALGYLHALWQVHKAGFPVSVEELNDAADAAGVGHHIELNPSKELVPA